MPYVGMVKKIRNFFLDTLFPVSCLSCAKTEEWLCDECLEKIPLNIEQVCPLCKKSITPDGKTCFECREKYSIDGILVSSYYREADKKTLLAKIIHYYKYRFIHELGNYLGIIMEKSLLSSNLPLPEIIIPVPLHPRRIRWRGFNQAEILSDYLGKNIAPGIDISVLKNFLIRSRYTLPQMGIKNHQTRKNNIKGAFSLNKNDFSLEEIRNKNVLLVDDIATTGSTMFECAKILKKNGAKNVYGIVLARE